MSAQPAYSQTLAIDASFVLYQYKGKRLTDSKWGKIPDFQRALEAALTACGKDGIGSADGSFGSRTQQGLFRLLSCPGFEDLAVANDHALYGAVHTVLWKRLLPDGDLPTVHQRAFTLSLTHEATDYDRVEWNYGTADDKSALTWGPYGATVGQGHEVRGILCKIHEDAPELLKNLFGEEFSTIEQLVKEDAAKGYALLKPVHADEQRRRLWKKHLEALGSTDKGREAYEWYAFHSGKWLTPSLRRLYSLIPDAKATATEIDYAFYLDLAMHTSIKKERVDDARKSIEAEQKKQGRPLTPAECRRVISQVWAGAVAPKWRSDRMGRNVAYYIDGVGRDKLTKEEAAAWEQRTGRSASNYGLSDSRMYYPAFFK